MKHYSQFTLGKKIRNIFFALKTGSVMMNDLISLTEEIESETGKRLRSLAKSISRPLSLWRKENPDWLLYTRWIDEQKRIRKWQLKSCWTPFPTKFMQLHPIMEKSLEIIRKSTRDLGFSYNMVRNHYMNYRVEIFDYLTEEFRKLYQNFL